MVPEIHIRCAAKAMIRCHGTRATSEATRQASEFAQAGDAEGREIWQRVVETIEKLQAVGATVR